MTSAPAKSVLLSHNGTAVRLLRVKGGLPGQNLCASTWTEVCGAATVMGRQGDWGLLIGSFGGSSNGKYLKRRQVFLRRAHTASRWKSKGKSQGLRLRAVSHEGILAHSRR